MTTLTVLVTFDDSTDPAAWFASVSDNDGKVANLKGPSAFDVLLAAAPIVDRRVADLSQRSAA